jgi:hypothetical protein
MFERTLTDLIRGLRANKRSEAKFIGIALDEIRKELKSNDLDLKANAIDKLNYVRTERERERGRTEGGERMHTPGKAVRTHRHTRVIECLAPPRKEDGLRVH